MNSPTNSNPDHLNPSPLNTSPGTIPRKKIAIMGFEEANGQTGPWNDPEWEVWGLNMANRMGYHHDTEGRFRADCWFDLHPIEPQSDLDMAWINACPIPIYLPTVFGENPNALAYPLGEIEQWLQQEFYVEQPYFASSFAYLMALAMYKGAETIGLFGVNLDWGRERIVERGNLEFYIGLAMGRGIRIIRSPHSKLLTHPARYGFEYDAERNQVITDCATVVRQLFQGKEFRAAIDTEFHDRIEALDRVQGSIMRGLSMMVHANRQQIESIVLRHNNIDLMTHSQPPDDHEAH